MHSALYRFTEPENERKLGIPALLKQAKKRGGVVSRIGWNPKPNQRVYVGNVAWAHIKAMETFKANPERIAGKAYFVTDNTPSLSVFELNEPYLSAFGYRYTKIAIPFTFLYIVLLLFEIVVWLLKPIYPLRLTMSRYSVVRLYYGHTFSRNNLHSDTGYEPRYTYEESFKRTLNYYLENPPS